MVINFLVWTLQCTETLIFLLVLLFSKVGQISKKEEMFPYSPDCPKLQNHFENLAIQPSLYVSRNVLYLTPGLSHTPNHGPSPSGTFHI